MKLVIIAAALLTILLQCC